jgi:ADP-ribosylation factor related protein 1
MVELSSPVLVLGVGGAGKSLLLRRLHALAKTGRVEPHVDADIVPSVGVDIVNLAIDKSRSLQLKEVGGAMMPLWPMYLNGAAALAYVVDASDAFQLAASAAAFHHLCDLPSMRGKPVLIVWNKRDAPYPLPRSETEAAFDLERARTALGVEGSVTTLDASALSGKNVADAMRWMRGIYGV